MSINWSPKKDGILQAIKADGSSINIFHYGLWDITPVTINFGDVQCVSASLKNFMINNATPKYQIIAIE